MTDEQMERLSRQFERIDQRFERIDQQFAEVHQRFDKVDQRFERVERDLKTVRDDVAAQSVTLERVDAEVHRRGIQLDQHTHELKLAIEAFQSLQHVTLAKLDLQREAIEQRLVPLELTVRSHSTALASHERRLDRLEE